MKEIKNIVLDFGGVIINIHHRRVEEAFRKLGVINFEKLFNQANQSHLFQDIETGTIAPAEFRNELRAITGLSLDDKSLDIAWNEIIGDYPSKRISLLQKIKSNYRLFLLSNTNRIHYDYYIPLFKENFGFDFNELFEKTYWSFEIGLRKPDPKAYLSIIENHSLLTEETLFIDDSIQNLPPAQRIGIKTFLLNPETDLTDLFENNRLKTNL